MGLRSLVLVLGLLTASTATAGEGLDIKSAISRPGVRLVVVEFYATWCKPCMAAIPRWKELHDKYRDQGLRLIVVNTQDPNGVCGAPGWAPDEMVCDLEGSVASGLGVQDLPSAFLWSWQGNLLAQRGHVDEVEDAIEQYFTKNPRVVVDATNAKGKESPYLRDLVRSELSRQGKFTVVATSEERALTRKIRKQGFARGYNQSGRCKLGQEVSANSIIKTTLVRGRLNLQLFSAESSCLLQSASVRWNSKNPERCTAEVVEKLLSQVALPQVQMPAGQSVSHAIREGTIGAKPTESWNFENGGLTLVEFDSSPQGAALLVNGKLVCTATPCSKSYGTGSSLHVQYQKERYNPATLKVLVKEGVAKVEATLSPDFGYLSIVSKPRNFTVELDGKPIGETPLVRYEVSTGPHRVMLKHSSYYEKGERIMMEAGAHRSLKLALIPREGGIEISSHNEAGNEVKSDVYLDDKHWGQTPLRKKVLIGSHNLKVRNSEHGDFEKEILVEERKTLSVKAVLESVGGGAMVAVPAGKFWMGCHPKTDNACGSDEKPGHTVYLDAYKIDKTEVTAGAYKACVDAGACRYNGGTGSSYTYNNNLDDHPINYVNHADAKTYCKWLGKRLPTEAEWEKAARGTDGRKYPWGNEAPTCDLAVMDGCPGDTQPVGSLNAGASPYGAMDMAGNLWEWTADWYGSRYYDQTPAGGWVNPEGPDSASSRVLRGGSLGHPSSNTLRASHRDYVNPDYRYLSGGFRCAQ